MIYIVAYFVVGFVLSISLRVMGVHKANVGFVAVFWPVLMYVMIEGIVNNVLAPCGYCGKPIARGDIRQHVMTCRKNPLVLRIEELEKNATTRE